MKRAWLAALLNFALPGAGTLYVGQRPAIGALLLLGLGAVRVGEVRLALQDLHAPQWPFLILGLLVVQLALALDGAREARALR